MTITSTDLESRLARFVEHHVRDGSTLSIDELCADRPDLVGPLRGLVDRYLSLCTALDTEIDLSTPGTPEVPFPRFAGFETIERLGAGGMGEVFKVRDLRLNRIVAAKVVRPGGADWGQGIEGFLREARALALFSDRRIVQIHEFRPDADPPVIVMEFVEGFELGRLGPSLEFRQRARIMVEVCEAVHHAHTLGLQHRDLKPSNIMLDAQLSPRILDFGLSAGDPARGHLVGTMAYVAPEQLDPSQPIDARADVYALGVILYELLCGRAPFAGDDATLAAQKRLGTPRLPVEIDARVPEPLQAIALTAMEAAPARRYQTALDMAADLRRFLEGRAVHGRPSTYTTTLETRVRPHVEEIREWLRLRLIYPHEAARLQSAYRALEAREDDWILQSRALSYPQIALYLGAFLLVCGSLFYFAAARWFGNVEGVAHPFMVLALPFIGLNAAAHLLYQRDHRAVAVAFYLAAVVLLPLFLLIVFHEARLFVVAPDTPGQLFQNGAVSNRQLQITAAVASAWGVWLALRTRTAALSTVFSMLLFCLTVGIVADLGLRAALDDWRWDLIALRFLPLVPAYAALGVAGERTGRPWFTLPQYLAAAALLVIVLELLALDGRAFQHLGVTLAARQPADVSDPRLVDTVAAMTLNGAIFYVGGALLTRRRSEATLPAAALLFAITPFALLHPLGYLVRTEEYAPRVDWLYAACALTIILLSQVRQRRSFYYAGMLNLGLALFFIADRRDWFERPAWAMAVIAAGLAVLVAGFALDRSSVYKRSPPAAK